MIALYASQNTGTTATKSRNIIRADRKSELPWATLNTTTKAAAHITAAANHPLDAPQYPVLMEEPMRRAPAGKFPRPQPRTRSWMESIRPARCAMPRSKTRMESSAHVAMAAILCLVAVDPEFANQIRGAQC